MKKIIAGIVALVILASVFTSCMQQAATITMIDSSKTLIVGKTYNLQYNLNPPNSNEKLSWTSSDEEIATVDNGTVTALKAGETEIKAVTQSGNTAVCNLTVKDIDITKVAVNPSSVRLKKGAQETLEAKVYPSTAEGADIDWASSNSSVASVTADGVVTAVGAGTVTITATAGNGKSGSATVTVYTKKTKSATYNPQPGPGPDSDNGIYPAEYYTLTGTSQRNWQFFDSSSRYLTDGEVSSLDYDDATYALNEIYARNGLRFTSSRWKDVFYVFDWYYPSSSSQSTIRSGFNKFEKSNVDALEKQKKRAKR